MYIESQRRITHFRKHDTAITSGINRTQYRLLAIRLLFGLFLIMYGPYTLGHHPYCPEYPKDSTDFAASDEIFFTSDDSLVDSIELRSERTEPISQEYSRTGLLYAPHRIVIEPNENKSEHTHDRRVTLGVFKRFHVNNLRVLG